LVKAADIELLRRRINFLTKMKKSFFNSVVKFVNRILCLLSVCFFLRHKKIIDGEGIYDVVQNQQGVNTNVLSLAAGRSPRQL